MILIFEKCNVKYPGPLVAANGDAAIIDVQPYSFFVAQIRSNAGSLSALSLGMKRTAFPSLGSTLQACVPAFSFTSSVLIMDDYLGVSCPWLVANVDTPEGSDVYIDLAIEFRE